MRGFRRSLQRATTQTNYCKPPQETTAFTAMRPSPYRRIGSPLSTSAQICGLSISFRSRRLRILALFLAFFMVFLWIPGYIAINRILIAKPYVVGNAKIAEASNGPTMGKFNFLFKNHDLQKKIDMIDEKVVGFLDRSKDSKYNQMIVLSTSVAGMAQSNNERRTNKTIDELTNDVIIAVKKEIDLGEIPSDDFVGLTRRISVYRYIYKTISQLAADRAKRAYLKSFFAAYDAAIKKLEPWIEKLERTTFPWLVNGDKVTSVRSLVHDDGISVVPKKSSRGIVMTCGDWHFPYARHTLAMIRHHLKSELPVELFYVGESDLDKTNREELKRIPNVCLVDLSELINVNGKEFINGWAIKPFTMLMSSFDELIFIDADALFFQKPEIMFNSPGYIVTGAMFYRDRTINAGSNSDSEKFVRKMVVQPSKYSRTQGRLLTGKSVHEGESGVVVWDKRKALFPILLTCVMNTKPYRDHLYKAFHGEKESYWIAHEALQVPYWWVPGAGGTIGYVKSLSESKEQERSQNGVLKTVCGGLYHPDDYGVPLWFNGGILRNKYSDTGRVSIQMTYWATDTSFNDAKWDWETETSPFCLTPQDPKRMIGRLTAKEQATADEMVAMWDKLKQYGVDGVFGPNLNKTIGK